MLISLSKKREDKLKLFSVTGFHQLTCNCDGLLLKDNIKVEDLYLILLHCFNFASCFAVVDLKNLNVKTLNLPQ